MGGSQLYSACSCPPPMCSLSEEERVRAVLRDLRKRTESEEVREDVERLEKVLSDPLFRQYNKKSSENAPRIHQRERLSLVEFLREAVEKELREGLKENQKLVFVEIHASSLRPEVLDPREPGNKLLVAGPKDIKSRSTGTIRIGDRIHAVATRYALCEPSKEGGANAQGGVSLSSVSGGPIVRGPTAVLFEEICDRAQAEGSLIAIAAIRESTNMVVGYIH